MTTGRKLFLLGSLYLAQGLPYGFFTQALPVLLHEQHVSLPLIGLSHLLTLPWALKFAWAPLVDRVRAPRFGRRRAVLVPLLLLSCAVLASLARAASPEAMWVLMVGVLLVNLCAATQDIATDGLAVEVLTVSERGPGNILQVGGYRIGMIFGGGLILAIFDHSWAAAFLAMGGMLLAATLPILLHREAPPPQPSPGAGADPDPGPGLRAALARPGLLPWFVVLATYKTGEWFATGMLRPFLTEQRMTKSDIAVMVGFAGFGAALVGALVGGLSVSRLGRRRALLLFGVLQSLAIASLALAVARPSIEMFYAVTVAEHLTSAMATTVLFTAMMDFCRPDEGGTDYTIQASLVVIATGLGSISSGVSAAVVDYGPHFLIASGLSFVGVLSVLAYRPSHPSFALVGPRPPAA